jgi:dehydrogenase/reductase SDR family member 7B
LYLHVFAFRNAYFRPLQKPGIDPHLMQFEGKTIWITGASSGIGEAVALELAQFSPRLILSGRNQEALEGLATTCRERGAGCEILPFDLGDPAEVEKAADYIIASYPRIDALLHFGGISQRSFASDTLIEVDRRIMEVNFFSTVILTKKLLPSMIRQRSGHIAVTSSIVGKFGISYRSAYSASKHALHGYFESVRAENAKHGIGITVIIPGRIHTAISLNALDGHGDKYGKMDAGQAGGMSAEDAARIIIRGLRRNNKEILFGGRELLMVYIRRFLPWLYYRLAEKVNPL